MLKEVEFELVFPSAWPSVFWHPHLRLLLAVYVDDFKMAGPKDNLAKGWELIGSRIDIDTHPITTREIPWMRTCHQGELSTGNSRPPVRTCV